MKRLLTLGVLVAALVPATGTTASPPRSTIVTGRIVPARATVIVFTSPRATARVHSDSRGRFRVTLPAGTYLIRAAGRTWRVTFTTPRVALTLRLEKP